MTHAANTLPRFASITRAVSVLTIAAGALSSTPASGAAQAKGPDLSKPIVTAPTPDPRVGLKAGLFDAGEAIWNLKKVGHMVSPDSFRGITNSDLAFYKNYVIQGNYNGFQIWDVSNPASPARSEERRVGKACRAAFRAGDE